MNIIETTEIFDNWLESLKDLRAKIQIATRIRRAENGNFGDHKLLPNTGGDKSSQQADIEKASTIFTQLKQQTGATK